MMPFYHILDIFLVAAGLYVLLLLFVRVNGLRSLSKMSAHDFAVTIAIGSAFGGILIQKDPSLQQGAFAIGFLLLLQCIFSLWRLVRPAPFLENKPLLLMRGPEILHANLKKARITEDELMGKLREANALNLDQVHAVVFEPTGDTTVLHGSGPLDKKLLQGVQDR